MYEVLEHEPPSRSRGGRALVVLAALAVAALVISRLVAAADPAAEPPPPPPTEEPASSPPVWSGPGQPIADAPVVIRMIELVAAGRLTLFHGQLDGGPGRTTLTGETPYASDAVTVLAYGAGVVVGPTPASPVPGTVRVFGVDVPPPTVPVAGIVPAVGGGYWIMDTATTAAGACQMHLVMLSGQMSQRSVTHPCSFVPERETVRGFVGRVDSGVSALSGTLLDRETGALLPIGGALLGSAERHVVRWTRDPSDPLVVEDVVSGDTFDVELPPGRVTRQVELSQGGRYLAVVLVERLITVRSYEVWVHDLVDGGSRVATVTTLDGSPLELAWQSDVLVIVGDGVEAYDVDDERLYRSTLEPLAGRLDVVAMSFALR